MFDIDKQFSILTSMRTAKTVSITMPPEMLALAQTVANREHRTMSELFREALRRYMVSDPAWGQLVNRTRAVGQADGVTSEEEAERLSDEYRREKKRQG